VGGGHGVEKRLLMYRSGYEYLVNGLKKTFISILSREKYVGKLE